MMSHEKLDVVQLAIQFVSLARRTLKRLPKGNADLADQLRRASRSVPLLIAEGVGKTTQAHQARYFSDARGSAFECAACLDVLRQEQMIEPDDFAAGKHDLERIVCMLTKMCR